LGNINSKTEPLTSKRRNSGAWPNLTIATRHRLWLQTIQRWLHFLQESLSHQLDVSLELHTILAAKILQLTSVNASFNILSTHLYCKHHVWLLQYNDEHKVTPSFILQTRTSYPDLSFQVSYCHLGKRWESIFLI
jgi:hypothetical protein